MKNILLILLLIAVPFQFAWAEAGTYCQHEQGQAALHFGHHDHNHVDHGEADPVKKVGGDDPDCSLHHSFFKIGIGQEIIISAFAQLVPADALNVRFTSFIPSGLERPDRGSLA
ncbi:MAG TPA: hypothetical protein VL550_07825 [Rhodocyclaceae bacterium]|jgi:hypothetical protein|nr:hypothetical protein [Rhodocyclaceae bacterium]